MDDPFVRFQTCVTEAQADIVRHALADAGIPSSVQGTSREFALAMGGTSNGGVYVLVPQSRLDDASASIDEIRRQDPGGPWRCEACGEDVDAGFDLCWSCQTPRGETELTRPAEECSEE